MVLQILRPLHLCEGNHWVIRSAEGVFQGICRGRHIRLVVVKVQMLFLVVGVELKVVRHARWVLCVVNHDEEYGR